MSDLGNINQTNLSAGLSQASAYTDFNALAELRAKVSDNSSEKSAQATREVAQQFESLFLQMMLKSMRDATYVDENGESDQTRFYQDMFDKQIALDLSSRENGGIGLAKIMEQQMSGGVQTRLQGNSQENSVEYSFNNLRTNFYNHNTADKHTTEQNKLTDNISANNRSHQLAQVKDKAVFDSPESFTQALWKHANKAAEKLGVKADVLIAQAALETGWGDKMIKDSGGKSANNLFGIKADSRWQGNQVTVSTLEFRDGVAAKELASFRAYDSFAQSFDDYAKFLLSSPRYQDALANTSNTNVFLEKLQQAGYSTDPAYAKKIQSITQRDSFVKTIKALSNAENSNNTVVSQVTNSMVDKSTGQYFTDLMQATNLSMRGTK